MPLKLLNNVEAMVMPKTPPILTKPTSWVVENIENTADDSLVILQQSNQIVKPNHVQQSLKTFAAEDIDQFNRLMQHMQVSMLKA